MTAEKVALTDAEHNEHSELAGRLNWDRSVYTEDAVERIVAARVAEAVDREAVDREDVRLHVEWHKVEAARLALVAKIEALVDEWDAQHYRQAAAGNLVESLRALLSPAREET